MAAFCLPPKLADKFTAALKDGSIDPEKLADMSSTERRKFFEGVVGLENAESVNALFESKLLLKDVKRGLVTWAKQVSGITEPARKDLLSKINRMPSELLTPVDEKSFLADLAKSRLGVEVTKEEAEQIAALSKAATDALRDRNALDERTWRAYGEAQLALTEYVNSLKPGANSWARYTTEAAIALGRGAAIATGDLSAAAALTMRVATPEWWQAAGGMFKWAAKRKNFDDLQATIRGDPDYDLMRSVVDFAELRPDNILRMDEAAPPTFLEDWNQYLKNITGGYVPNIAAASNRAFVGAGNYVRYKAMKGYIAAGRLAGEDVSIGSKWLSDIGDVVNTTTTRGKWGITKGGALEKLGVSSDKNFLKDALSPASVIFWTPRRWASALRFYNPWYYMSPNVTWMARKEQLKLLIGQTAILGTTLSLFKMMGYDVETDPRHTNFARVGSGRVQFDPTQGQMAQLRLMARLATGISISSNDNITVLGQGYRAPDQLSLIGTEMRNKLIPWAGNLASLWVGEDPAGRPFGVPEFVANTVIPMGMSQMIELAMEEPDNVGAIILSPFTLFGVGMQVQAEPKNTSRWDQLGAPKGTDQSANPVNRALLNAGIELRMPPRNILSVPLDDRLYDEYAGRTGKKIQAEIAQVLRTTPGFNRLAVGEQEKLLREHIAAARKEVRGYMTSRYPQILREADRLKQQWAKQGTPAAQARRAAQ